MCRPWSSSFRIEEHETAKDLSFFFFGTLSMTHEGVRQATLRAVQAARGAGMLQKAYPNIRVLNVTAGAEGSYSFYGDADPVFVPACTLGGVIETTGAGDTFCASVLDYVLTHGLENLTPENRREMLRFANTAAYIVTTRKGAIRAMPREEEVRALL